MRACNVNTMCRTTYSFWFYCNNNWINGDFIMIIFNLNKYRNLMNGALAIVMAISLSACTTQKLYAVNDDINSYQYISDTVNHLSELTEFYENGGGDCEDFANAKYEVLIQQGILEDDMRFILQITNQPL